MTDLLDELAARNPVPECPPTSIDDVWRKVAALETGPRARLGGPSRRLPRRAARISLTLAAVITPTLVVLAAVLALRAARHAPPHAASAQPSPASSTLVPAAQRAAARALGARAGSVVVLDPRTGAIEALYTRTEQGGRAVAGEAAADARYPAEATIDIVTAAAALDSGRYTAASRIAGPSPLSVSGSPLRNDEGESFGPITLTQALSMSVNTVFARVGEALGRQTVSAYLRRFGFYSAPRLTPGSEPIPASGVRIGGALALPTDPRVDLGRVAAGQGTLSATPLQIAMLAAVVADDGTLVAPRLRATAPRVGTRVMSAATARALAGMLRAVVTSGTATAADLPGLSIAGKTGTAPVGGAGSSQRADLWFVGFAPAGRPAIAIAVVLSGARGGYGGTRAATVAAVVIRALVRTRR